MLFRIDPEIFSSFPEVKVGIIVAQGIDNSTQHKVVLNLLEKQVQALTQKLTSETLRNHPYITTWHHAYKKFGVNPKEHLSSVENLARRAIKNKNLRSINTLVDLYNIISLKYLIPAGGEDLDTFKGNVRLTVAADGEKPVILLGDSTESFSKKGEVIYKDDEGIICRCWNWKEADRTKLTEKTKNAFLVLEALPPVDPIVLKAAVNELAKLIKEYCGGEVSFAIVDAQNPEIVLKEAGKYKLLEKKLEVINVPFDVYEVTPSHAHSDKQESLEYEQRVEKVKKLREMGIEPWPGYKEITATGKQVVSDFVEDGKERKYAVAGRVMTIRLHGKTAFAHIQDSSGRLQIYLKTDVVGEDNFKFFEQFIDIGDIIWCFGHSFKTKMGEITLSVEEFSLLSKCLHPLPEKFHGLTDIEIKYRQRYLDLIMNQDTRERFMKRSAIISSIRCYLDAHGYMEVETPMLHPIAGGAAARPFITHHNALSSDFFLRIAPELYLKRLVVGGFERVYEINRNFRNEGISTRHNPEFTMLEFYTAHQDYHYGMNFVEELLRNAAQQACGTLKLPFGDYLLNFEAPFERLSMKKSVMLYGKCTEVELEEKNIDKLLAKHEIKLANKKASVGEKIYALFEALVETKLIQPTFIIDFPIEISPLAKRDPNNPEIASRYELFMAGMEISNCFNELNDPFDQAQRFYEQLKAHEAGDVEAHQFDADFVKALEYGLPPTVGVGIGIDRLVMILTNTTSIKEVILFPTLKKKEEA